MNDTITEGEIKSQLAQNSGELSLFNKNISDMSGFEIFKGTDLKVLDVSFNHLTSLDVSGLTALKTLFASPLTKANVTGFDPTITTYTDLQ